MTKTAAFLEQLNEAFATGDTEFILGSISDDIRWTMVGNRTVEGKEAFEAALEEMERGPRTEITLDRIITHGNEAAVNGIIQVSGESGGSSMYAFCDVYRFSSQKNTRINELTSYVILLSGDEDS